jgi:hypothetical protein
MFLLENFVFCKVKTDLSFYGNRWSSRKLGTNMQDLDYSVSK